MARSQKTPPPGMVYDLLIENVRVCFLHLEQTNSGGEYPSHKYELHGLIHPDAPAVKTLRDAALTAARSKWGDGMKAADIIVGLRNGDDKGHLDGFPGMLFINPKSKRPIPCFGPGREEIDAGAINAGDYCNLLLTAGTYPRNLEKEVADALREAGKTVHVTKDDDGKVSYWRPAVTFYLNAVQLRKRGEPLGGGRVKSDAFPVIDPEDADAPFG